jgi:hypothetical protein
MVPMVSELSDAELQDMAAMWRTEALRGSKEARGQAHLLEVEQRRRLGVPGLRDNTDLDLRPLAERQVRRSWWQRG